MKEFKDLEKQLNISFKNKDLLTQAFVHRSYLNENPDFGLSNNERLEFLGDAVLELVVTRELFENYPDKSEGELTAWRASLVNAKMLVIIAKELDLSSFLLFSFSFFSSLFSLSLLLFLFFSLSLEATGREKWWEEVKHSLSLNSYLFFFF